LHISGDPWWSTNKLLPPLCKANLFQNPLPWKSDDEWKRFIITLFQPRMNLNIQVGNIFYEYQRLVNENENGFR